MRYALEIRCGLGARSLKVVHHVGHFPLKSLRTAIILDLAFRMTFGIHLRTCMMSMINRVVRRYYCKHQALSVAFSVSLSAMAFGSGAQGGGNEARDAAGLRPIVAHPCRCKLRPETTPTSATPRLIISSPGFLLSRCHHKSRPLAALSAQEHPRTRSSHIASSQPRTDRVQELSHKAGVPRTALSN